MSLNSNFVLWRRNQTLEARIAELEAQAAAYEERIGMLKAEVETLTPKPVVVSRWANLYDTDKLYGGWHCSFVQAQNACDGLMPFLGVLRKDTTTHPDGRVEYRLEVEG